MVLVDSHQCSWVQNVGEREIEKERQGVGKREKPVTRNKRRRKTKE